MNKKRVDTRRMVLLAMLSCILLVMSFTPLGYLPIGPLAISLNMIPVAIGAVALGPGGGAFLGAVFGITSCLQCVGIGGKVKTGSWNLLAGASATHCVPQMGLVVSALDMRQLFGVSFHISVLL